MASKPTGKFFREKNYGGRDTAKIRLRGDRDLLCSPACMSDVMPTERQVEEWLRSLPPTERNEAVRRILEAITSVVGTDAAAALLADFVAWRRRN